MSRKLKHALDTFTKLKHAQGLFISQFPIYFQNDRNRYKVLFSQDDTLYGHILMGMKTIHGNKNSKLKKHIMTCKELFKITNTPKTETRSVRHLNSLV